MCKNEQSIHYCTILSAGQWDFLLDGKAAIDRQKCLHRLMTAAVRTKTVLRIKGVEIELEVGQAAASDVELAEYMGCNRKTIGKPHLDEHPYVCITYFVPDLQKEGGKYETHSGSIKSWDEYEQRITFDDNTQVKANEIIDIKGELFDNRAF